MEFTTDTQGNKYFSFEEDDDSYLFEINQIGNKLDDFEILQILTELKNILTQTAIFLMQFFQMVTLIKAVF